MILAVVFTIGYQSLHILLDEHHHHNSIEIIKSKSKIKITEKEDCPICDFHFAAFLKTDFATYKLLSKKGIKSKTLTYNNFVKSSKFILFSHRGPPINC